MSKVSETSSKSKRRIWSKIGERVRRDFFFQAAAGSMPGVSAYDITGYDPAVGPTAKLLSKDAVEYFTDYQPLSIVSDSVNDAYRGTGAWVLRVLGLDYQYELQLEDILLKGTTPVLSQGEYIRVLAAAVLKSGSIVGTDGILTVTGNSDSKLVGTIDDANRLLNGAFTIPAHTNGYLFSYSFSMGAPKEVTIGLRFTSPVPENRNWVTSFADFMYGGRVSEDLTIPEYFPALTDIELFGYINVNSTTYMAGNMALVLIDEAFEWDNILSQDEMYSVDKDE